MKFEKGHQKLGGKKKGYRSFKVEDVLRAAKFCPIEELLRLYPTLPKAVQAKVLLELHSYLEAKPKHESSPDPYGMMSTKELIVLVKDKIPELIEPVKEKETD